MRMQLTCLYFSLLQYKNCHSPEDYEFGSPLVDVRISPLLAIPPSVIGRICEYLEGRFVSTNQHILGSTRLLADYLEGT